MSESEAFETERERARELLSATDLTALHVGVVHADDTVDTVVSRRTDGEYDEGLQALSLLATHLRAVATEAGVGYETVAGDAAAVAAQLEELPVDSGGRGSAAPGSGTDDGEDAGRGNDGPGTESEYHADDSEEHKADSDGR